MSRVREDPNLMLLDKNILMQLVAAGVSHECFEHSTSGHYDITLMRQGISTGMVPSELIKVEIDLILSHVRESRVTEESRWMALPMKSWFDDPGIIVMQPNPEGQDWTIMIDGHHRLLRRHYEGKDWMAFYVVEYQHVIRPDPRLTKLAEWGDPMIDGKIIRQEG